MSTLLEKMSTLSEKMSTLLRLKKKKKKKLKTSLEFSELDIRDFFMNGSKRVYNLCYLYIYEREEWDKDVAPFYLQRPYHTTRTEDENYNVTTNLQDRSYTTYDFMGYYYKSLRHITVDNHNVRYESEEDRDKNVKDRDLSDFQVAVPLYDNNKVNNKYIDVKESSWPTTNLATNINLVLDPRALEIIKNHEKFQETMKLDRKLLEEFGKVDGLDLTEVKTAIEATESTIEATESKIKEYIETESLLDLELLIKVSLEEEQLFLTLRKRIIKIIDELKKILEKLGLAESSAYERLNLLKSETSILEQSVIITEAIKAAKKTQTSEKSKKLMSTSHGSQFGTAFGGSQKSKRLNPRTSRSRARRPKSLHRPTR
jgi:hypothetical protein